MQVGALEPFTTQTWLSQESDRPVLVRPTMPFAAQAAVPPLIEVVTFCPRPIFVASVTQASWGKPASVTVNVIPLATTVTCHSRPVTKDRP
ncbi:hypothetical protein ALO97_04903 [Pseudomonas syringae pv. tagetis]|nr:hypothetical protein ALO97_04903 [Pseudomonas syringae pv. tagetis]